LSFLRRASRRGNLPLPPGSQTHRPPSRRREVWALRNSEPGFPKLSESMQQTPSSRTPQLCETNPQSAFIDGLQGAALSKSCCALLRAKNDSHLRASCNRLIAAIVFVAITGAAMAQQPDLQVKADLYADAITGKGENNALRFYDLMGHYATVALSVTFEQGYHIWASERLERIVNNRDSEQLDEYYVEDPGIWRLGKQYLPFGRQGLLREDARAARGDSRLLIRDVPISVAVCDNGTRLAQGVVGRLGSVIGLSFAFGHNFGAESTDFTVVRRPEDPIRGQGYEAIVGIDFARHFGMYTFQIEGAALRNGETVFDRSTDIADALVTIQPNKYQALTFGISRDWDKDLTLFRVQGKFLVTRSVWLEPIIRTRNSEFYDLGVAVHVKL
jgi:hypothetical protein